jgi:serine O-acetyltransferase
MPGDSTETPKHQLLVDLVVQATSELTATAMGEGSLLARRPGGQEHPSSSVVLEVVEALRAVFFPGYFGVSEMSAGSVQFHIGSTLDRAIRVLREQIRRGLCFVCKQQAGADCSHCGEKATQITGEFVGRLPEIRRLVGTDVQAAYEGDPAATSPDEAIFCYPGIYAIMNQRIAHELYRLDVPLIPRMITEAAHSQTGIDIHPGARIGERFFIDHGTGVVIGETTIIGNNVRIYQGVTLGAKSFPLDEHGKPIKGIDRHPIVEDHVTIYAGATILGRVVIGEGATIGGNVWLTRGVSPGAMVTQSLPKGGGFEYGDGI